MHVIYIAKGLRVIGLLQKSMNTTYTSGSNMCLIFRQGVGEHGGELGLPVIITNACPCQTLLLRRGVDCSEDTALPISQKNTNEKHIHLITNKFHNAMNKYNEDHIQLHLYENLKPQKNRIVSHNIQQKINLEGNDWLGSCSRNTK